MLVSNIIGKISHVSGRRGAAKGSGACFTDWQWSLPKVRKKRVCPKWKCFLLVNRVFWNLLLLPSFLLFKTKEDSPKFQAKASLEEVQGYQNWNIEEGEEEAKEEGWEKGGEESREEKDQKVKERSELHEVISSIISFPVMLKVYDAIIGRHTSYLGMLSLPTGKI